MKNLLLLLAIICLAGCKKEDTSPQLPAVTHKGANTFGCKIDGEVFVTSGKSYRGSLTGVAAIPYISTAWYIEGRNGSKHITLQFDYNSHPIVPGTFTMAGIYPYIGYYFYYPDGTVPTGSTEYDTDSAHTGTVTVTDYTTTYASGTFAFDAINGDGKVVHITEGRFDISF